MTRCSSGNRILVLATVLIIAARGVPDSTLFAAPAEDAIRLVDHSLASGLDFVHEDGSSGQEYLVEFMGAGIALFDYDGDGWIDVYFLNGAALEGTELTRQPTNALYRNQGDGTFLNVTAAAGVGNTGYGLGVAAADFDNDGYDDLYVSNYGPNVLYHNNGDGTFTDITQSAGVADGVKFGAGVAFLDADKDGFLDIYSANYIDFSYPLHAKLARAAYPYPPVPADYPPVPDTLFRNLGNDSFADVSRECGIGNLARPSMGIVCGDFDGDADTDVYVACDGAPSLYFDSRGNGGFDELGVVVGVAFDAMGLAEGMMGPEAGDVDNDGREDLFVTDYSGQSPVLFRNLGEAGFEDISRVSRTGKSVMPHTNWGAGLVDLDNDGDRDLFISNGHMLKRARSIEQFTDFRVPNCLLANDGHARFHDISASAGSGLTLVQSSRGTGFDDLDNDGDLDCVILNCCARANYLENQSNNSHHWVELQLRGVNMNRDAVGARVRVVAGDLVQVAEVRSGRAYQSHFGSRLHFGLGAHDHIDRVEVYWLDTHPQVYENVPVDKQEVLIQR